MKKTICIALALMMIFAFGACGDKQTEGMLIKDGVLMVGSEPEYPPMEYMNENGEYVGFDVEFAKAIADYLGLELEYVPTGWDGIFMGLDAMKYDVVMSSVSITKARLEGGEMIFSDPYMNNGQYIVVKKGDASVVTAEDLAGKKVGVQFATTADTACGKYLEKISFELLQYDTIMLAFTALDAGHIEAIVVDYVVAIDYVSKNPEKYEITSAKLTNEPLGIAMNVNNTALQEKINEAIAALMKDGTMKAISEKYFDGYDATKNIDATIE